MPSSSFTNTKRSLKTFSPQHCSSSLDFLFLCLHASQCSIQLPFQMVFHDAIFLGIRIPESGVERPILQTASRTMPVYVKISGVAWWRNGYDRPWTRSRCDVVTQAICIHHKYVFYRLKHTRLSRSCRPHFHVSKAPAFVFLQMYLIDSSRGWY